MSEERVPYIIMLNEDDEVLEFYLLRDATVHQGWVQLSYGPDPTMSNYLASALLVEQCPPVGSLLAGSIVRLTYEGTRWPRKLKRLDLLA